MRVQDQICMTTQQPVAAKQKQPSQDEQLSQLQQMVSMLTELMCLQQMQQMGSKGKSGAGGGGKPSALSNLIAQNQAEHQNNMSNLLAERAQSQGYSTGANSPFGDGGGRCGSGGGSIGDLRSQIGKGLQARGEDELQAGFALQAQGGDAGQQKIAGELISKGLQDMQKGVELQQQGQGGGAVHGGGGGGGKPGFINADQVRAAIGKGMQNRGAEELEAGLTLKSQGGDKGQQKIADSLISKGLQDMQKGLELQNGGGGAGKPVGFKGALPQPAMATGASMSEHQVRNLQANVREGVAQAQPGATSAKLTPDQERAFADNLKDQHMRAIQGAIASK